ncbi:ATP-binding cassette domain-containing protein, partial [Oleiphilus sp. HI0125]
SIQGLPLIQVIESRFGAAQSRSLDDSNHVAITNSRIQNTGQVMTQVIGTLSIVIAVLAVMQGLNEPSAMIVIIILVWKALTPIMGVFNAITRFKSIQSSARQVNALMSLDDDRQNLEKSPPIDQVSGNIQVHGLTHRYSGSTKGLTNLEFKVNAGSKVTIVGPPGCGKTSLLKVLGNLE